MLVLTRHVDERIAIGDNIVITVLGIEGDRVKLGISAPREVPILRFEVYEAVKEQTYLQSRLAEQPEPGTFDKLRKLLEENIEQEKPEQDQEKPAGDSEK